MSFSLFVAVAPQNSRTGDSPESFGVAYFTDALIERWPTATVTTTTDDRHARLRFARTVHDDVALQRDDDCFALRKPDSSFFLDFVAWFREAIPAQRGVIAFDDQGNSVEIPALSSRDAVAIALQSGAIL